MEWLTAQGARGAYVKSASGLINPELASALAHWAANADDPAAEPWQNAISEYRRQSLKALDFDPARMVQYAAGRPCVVQTQQINESYLGDRSIAWHGKTDQVESLAFHLCCCVLAKSPTCSMFNRPVYRERGTCYIVSV